MVKVPNLDNDRDANGAVGRYVKLPVTVLNDRRISANAVRVFGVMVDCNFDGSKISLRRIAERLGFSRTTARRATNELIEAGHVRNREPNGKCPVYEILTPIAGGTGTGPYSNARGYQVRNRTGATRGTQTKRSSLNLLPSEEKTLNDAKDGALDRLIVALADCHLHGEPARREAERLLRFYPGLSWHFVGHVRDAISQEQENPIRYAEEKTRRGEIPRSAPRV